MSASLALVATFAMGSPLVFARARIASAKTPEFE